MAPAWLGNPKNLLGIPGDTTRQFTIVIICSYIYKNFVGQFTTEAAGGMALFANRVQSEIGFGEVTIVVKLGSDVGIDGHQMRMDIAGVAFGVSQSAFGG